jgi:hypothetical protein
MIGLRLALLCLGWSVVDATLVAVEQGSDALLVEAFACQQLDDGAIRKTKRLALLTFPTALGLVGHVIVKS